MLTRSLFLSALLASPLAAQAAHPDFSGTWVLDAGKSSAEGSMQVPTTSTYVIVQVGDSINAELRSTGEAGEMVLKKVWRVDGKAWINYLTYQGTDMTLSSVLSWTGTVLTIHTTTEFNGTPVEQNESWTLSTDGTTLTHATVTTANGEEFARMSLVFVKKKG
jgi:hypothetical protein